MPSTDLLLTYWPGWLALTIAVVMAFNKAVEESYKFASIWGKWGKRVHAKALSRHHVDLAAAQFAQAVQKAVDTARETWEAEDNEAIKALDDRLGTVSRVTADQKINIDELIFQVRCLTAYTEYEGLWHNRFRAEAARAVDGRLSMADLPGHIGFYEFEVHYKANQQWRQWSDL